MKTKYLAIITILFLAIVGCKKNPEVNIAVVQLSNEIITPYTRAVTITSNYTYPTELKDVTIIVSKNNDLSDAVTQKATTTASTIEVNVTELEGGTTYYYCFEYISGNVSSKSPLKSFKTLDYSKPTVSTSEVTEITTISAKCGGNVTNDGGLTITARGICWSTSTTPEITDNHTTDGSGLGNFTSSLTNLVIGKKYYVRAYATNSKGTNYGEEKSFITKDGNIILTTSEVTEISATSAKCGGYVFDDGGLSVTARGICWSTSTTPEITDNHTTDGSGLGNFTSSLTNLVIGKKYYVRAYATNSKGTNYGEEKSFITKDGTIILTTSEVTEITAISAKCGGNVTNDGGLTITSRGVCWSTSSTPEITDNHTTDGSGLGNFTSSLTNLEIGTTYYVRAYATNSKGTNYGEEKSFITKDGTIILTTSEVTEITATSAKCGGYVFNDGGLTITARGVCWSTSSNPEITDNHTTDGSDLGSFISSLTNMVIETRYYVRAYATNSKGTNYGEEKSFITKDGNIILTTSEVTEITAATAKCGGNVVDDGGFDVIARGVCWSTLSNPEITDNHTTDGSGLGNFISSLTNLEMETTYYVRSYATNSKGTNYGEEKSFITKGGNIILTTSEVTEITTTSAKCGGFVFDDGGFDVTARGVCWSTSPNPEITDNHTTDGSGLGTFISSLTYLEIGTTYYVRAYAINIKGINYGEEKSFETIPIGSISGIFSVSSTKQVYFSQGNLQHRPLTNTWRFAENQYDYIGEANSNISSSYSEWIDLFGWGTSGQNTGASAYQPYSTSTTSIDYYPGGSYTNNLTYDNKADWGYNVISNGGSTMMQWRTLSGGYDGEWYYLWNTRTNASSKRGYARINGINGIVLLPDNWTQPSGVSFIPNTTNFYTNTYSVSDWIIMENNGAVFLPAAGYRIGTHVYAIGSLGCYWSSSYYSSNDAYKLEFANGNLDLRNHNYRFRGDCVRLVQDL